MINTYESKKDFEDELYESDEEDGDETDIEIDLDEIYEIDEEEMEPVSSPSETAESFEDFE